MATSFAFRITEKARQFLFEEGTDQRDGARHLNPAIKRSLIYPLATLLATQQLRPGDLLIIDRHRGENCLRFAKDTEQQVSYPCAAMVAPNGVPQMNAEIHG